MYLIDFLKEKMIWLDNRCRNTIELFQMVSDQALQLDLVTTSFLSKINERESCFPTGIQLNGYGIAIPHTDPDCIKEQFIGIIIPQKTISFKSMENEKQVVNVDLIFILGLNQPHCQLTVLQQIMRVIQNKNHVNQLVKAKNYNEIIQIFQNISLEDK
ncbi:MULTISPECIES: PTS sugar transporter subunit IIA [unclassified Gilliamella]|uniref:PTS sugar transporter subunit IIA n=1 Tax=unclassified Gilliamella TaxID=2685620 RepID=UPI0022699962|nr:MULTISPECIES: PTS sugar transporter subunit IIA [unclassified Gilliamella]MCX8584103.1 PTS sugar transporter subunit IIA [Gilliamella sp. B3372]MCX8586435.1 PTS sugar transporter subunit IIA [Gilliamella sp. B3562]MCX8593944.1 PTS sugar transporter subunit IIA [Gilliamella sp. B3367]MCX8685905.1 PTS sugar transporter subunit IIA [Gilliamella sp. B2864]